MRVARNRKLKYSVKRQVEEQKYETNIKRVEEIMRASQERYNHEQQQLQNLSTFVQERSEWVEENEQKMIENMHETVDVIRQMRQYPKEKDVVLGYLNKQNEVKYSPKVKYNEYFHDFNSFTPVKGNQNGSTYSSCHKGSTDVSSNRR